MRSTNTNHANMYDLEEGKKFPSFLFSGEKTIYSEMAVVYSKGTNSRRYTDMTYYRYWIEKDLRNQVYETAKAIGFEICDNKWITHMKQNVAWFPKSQVIIEENEDQIDYYIPEWLFKKNHYDYFAMEGINKYRPHIVER